MAAPVHKIHEAISRLQLDLKDKVVITEAATGAYVVTPVLAALAGARVIAVTKSTRYGSVDEVKSQTLSLLDACGQVKGSLDIVEELTPDMIASADVITNSGHVRPLDAHKLQHCKQGAVVPLMYEAWEWREADVSLDLVREKQLVLGATNERHPDVDVFNYLGDMAVKMIFDAGLNPYRNRFVLLCNNDFGPHIAQVVSKLCDKLGVIDSPERKNQYAGLNIEWLGDFPSFDIPESFRNAAGLLFTAYPFTDTWIGQEHSFSIQKVSAQLPHATLLRYCGHVDEETCAAYMPIHPAHVHPGHMGILPSAIGYDPIIRLQSGSLKVAELLLKNETHYNGEILAEIIAH